MAASSTKKPRTSSPAHERQRAKLPIPVATASPEPVTPATADRIRSGHVGWLTVRGAVANNLKNVDVSFPLGRMTCVTGVSGSGKSTLVNDILYAALARDLNLAQTVPAEHAGIDIAPGGSPTDRPFEPKPDLGLLTRGRPGAKPDAAGARRRPAPSPLLRHLDKIIAIDQTPIGRTPRSNPATYIKLFDEIRDLFTKLPDAKLRGYKPGRFSFNVAAGPKGGGRCEACEGNGANKIEMDFLADVWVGCPVCEGRRFTRETLQIRYKGKSIAEVLEMDVQQALELFENVPRIRTMLQTLHDVGLDYLKLGQASTTLSGGEAQRIKLARELVKRATGRTVYVLDEPTTGLHFEDVRKLLEVLHSFVDAGNTVIIIEHNLDVVKTADWIIDLGPEGGAAGGRILAEGTPEDVAANQDSYTGQALREILESECGSNGKTLNDERRTLKEGGGAHPSSFRVQRSDLISVRGARQHNLRDVSVSFPRDKMTVCTGVSGSGKTSFAIDTVFTEGYRRYVESLSAYARQFLGQLQKPKVEHVEGLSPAICIEQKSASKSPRSTVGTITEIYDYMRVLWARIGTRYCPRCQVPIGTQTAEEIVNRAMDLGDGTPIILLAPVALGDGETYAALFNRLKASGYMRARIDGEIQLTAQATTLDARRKHKVEVVVDRTVVRAKSRGRINESIEHALALGNGLMTVVVEAGHEADAEPAPASDQSRERERAITGVSAEPSVLPSDDARSHRAPTDLSRARNEAVADDDNPPPTPPTADREFLFSQKLACARCGTSYEELGPQHLSFNSPLGWCETCEGLGVQRGAPAGVIIKNPSKTLFDGALAGWGQIDRRTPIGRTLTAFCQALGVDSHVPLSAWTPKQRNLLLFGSGESGAWIDGPKDLRGLRFRWRGLFPTIDSATRNSFGLRMRLQNLVTDIPCMTCRGGRLRPDSAAIRLTTDLETLDPSRAANQSRERKRVIEGDASEEGNFITRESLGPQSKIENQNSKIGLTLVDICDLPLTDVRRFFADLKLAPTQRKIAGELLKEIGDRLQFLIDVGLDYLNLHRAAPTLSGGEAQRIRLASQIGSGLSGVLYVLDEPTIGLHPRDNRRLVNALLKLRDLGNTLLVVEHDREVIAAADKLLDFGPRAGALGGRVVWETDNQNPDRKGAGPSGPAADPSRDRTEAVPETTRLNDIDPVHSNVADSLTREYLAGTRAIAIPSNRRPVPPPPIFTAADAAQPVADRESDGPVLDLSESQLTFPELGNDLPLSQNQQRRRNAALREAKKRAEADAFRWLLIRGARQNNLKNLDVPFPLGRLTVVTGVSGSGKSSLINDILWPALANQLQRANLTVGEHDAVEVVLTAPADSSPHSVVLGAPRLSALALGRHIDKVINVDQAPLGTTPTSNPSTYTGAFDLIRELFARLPDSKVRGYNANRFSFNRPGGRCEACEGYGQRRIEMHFMPDVWVECEVCKGQRYESETLNVRFKGKNISEVLNLRVAEALPHFENVPKIRRVLQTLADVGLDYVQLGQPAPTLSGGEAQRVKLAAELGKPQTGQTLYILDEPTTGLHFEDVRKLLTVIHRLVDLGNTVVVVEHNLDVIKSADWVIDLGPEAGEAGGHIVAVGTPEQILNFGFWTLDSKMAQSKPFAQQAESSVDYADSESGSTSAAVSQSKIKNQKSKIEAAAAGAIQSKIQNPKSKILSHTATALRPILTAGPYEQRVVYDPKEHARRETEIDKAGLGGVGKEIKPPWVLDGRKWHLSQRTSRDGKPVRWQPAALEFVVDLIQQTGAAADQSRERQRVITGVRPEPGVSTARNASSASIQNQKSKIKNLFAPTNWSDRASIEITAPGAETWFFHALTGGEWLLELYFLTPTGTFDAASLNRRLGLKTLDQREDLETYGNWPRVDVRARARGVDAVVIYVHDKQEIDTPAFRRFIKEAVAAYAKSV